MKIVIDQTGRTGTVDARDFTSFSVEAPSSMSEESIGTSLGELGSYDGSHAWVNVRQLRDKLNLGPGDGASFDTMIAFAASHGWISGDSATLRSHVVKL